MNFSKFQIRIHPLAALDFEHAKNWYNLQKENLGNEFTLELEKLFSHIANNPKQYPKFRNNIRKAVVKRFPYSVFFEIESDFIKIYAIFHNSRRPITWKKRVK